MTRYLLLLIAFPVRAEEVDFARDVRPILTKSCLRCHGPKKQEGGLRLDLRRRVQQGGDTGPALGLRGEIVRRLQSKNESVRMPPSGALPEAEIAKLQRWIEQGATWPDALAGKDNEDDHWAFQPVKRPTAASIDAIIPAKEQADRSTLIRRLYLDLVGLPPSPAEVEWARNDKQEDWYGRLVERLLASPHFGERWGRHWLDLARFAESDGYENDRLRPDAYRYRDWVIDAFNRDLPFDEFTIQQLAGDLLPNATLEQKTATGMHRNTLYNSAASGDKEEFRTYAIKDRAETTAAVWMGLTLACANCHSHKYDPISQREYYQLYAFFNNTNDAEITVPGGRILALNSVKRTSYVHLRGSFLRKGPEVSPGTPSFLPPLANSQAATRLDLARWLVDPKHPLTARVAVNHLWIHLLGQSLVPTPENFGTSGQPPTHPELLDWLASEFVRLGWSRKEMIRTIVHSSAYRQASSPKTRHRVEAEIVRDLALSVSGLLQHQRGGPSVVPPFPRELPTGQFTAEALKMPTKEYHRRGIYIHVQRTLTHPTLGVFDVADGNQACIRRTRTTTPMQALTLLNDPTFLEAAKALGTRLRQEGMTNEERLRTAYMLCLGREPSTAVRTILVELIEKQQRLGAKEETVWFGVARVLLNMEEFTTRP